MKKIFLGIWLFTLLFPATSWSKKTTPVNLVVITVDTLRADRLGCYGYRRIKTPQMDALAGEGVLFEQAFTPVPTTLPSHTSMFTGKMSRKRYQEDHPLEYERMTGAPKADETGKTGN